ncbi:MAG: methylamine dehydrogenase accessory protein MauD [Cellvibrionaceae bacterium]|nr:methylamine dehydrogenase accessory protein MauD [Cellvibrionaceae bacterium]
MSQTLLVSNGLLWLAVLLLATTVYALARQIGVLHERIKPVGALALGQALQVGAAAPVFREPSLTGGMVKLGGERADGKATLLFFMSSSCPVCKVLIPVLRRLGEQEKHWLQLVFLSDGDEGAHRQTIVEHKLENMPYLLSTEIGMAYQISKLPYGVLLGADGQVAAHGLLNNREHIESLFEAYRASAEEQSNVERLAG